MDMMGPDNDYSDFQGDDDFGWGDDQGMDDSEDMNYPGPSNYYRFNMGPGKSRFGRGRGGGRPPPFFGPPGPMGPPMPYGPSGGPPPFMWGRGFGPGGPPIRRPNDNKALRYLMRCGVAKENLKNLPRDLLDLIDPENCGICGQSFDSFSTSRLHYISKNHLKCQKKWLAQQSEMGFSRQKEIPLKSRDLYCELCDVQITSKTHADSHYSGKPHRAIVMNRKNPKNPFLLQKGMEDRVEQLIRREKKHLKTVIEAREEVQEKANETKAIQPELYCDICKTSVTCTEQMTMHLNGKRHLSKEKLHILKMMKGEVDTKDAAANKSTESKDVTETDSATKDAESIETSTAQTAEGQEDDWAAQW